MLGDTAVAVNPKDERASKFIGKKVKLPFVNREIPVLGDDYVKRGEGTGFLKVTPAHDPNDYEIGLRHNLPMINIFTPDAKVNENGAQFKGMDRYEARKAVVAELEKMGLLEKVEPREHEVGHSYRSHVPIEPYLSDQWFVKVGPLAKPAIEAVESGKVKIHPKRYERTYLDWLMGVRDWCISRQLWWGHRIPVWTRPPETDPKIALQMLKEMKDLVGDRICIRDFPTGLKSKTPDGEDLTGIEIFVSVGPDSEDIEEVLNSTGWVQDPDVLDTWFSSALWPHSTMGWPDQTEELKFYYPTNTLITSRDIITLWVSRMVMMGIENVGDVPFKDVFIHGKILDGQGQTMSKSKGNGIDPVDIISTYGADAMRFSLAMMTTESQDMRMPVTKDEQGRNVSDKFDLGRNFCNKLWNASRFAMMNLEGMDPAKFDAEKMTIADKWILSRLAETITDVTEMLEDFKFNEPLTAIYKFFWNDLCDWYLEWIKPRMRDENLKQVPQNVLAVALDQTLRMLHPFVPFITEGIFQQLNKLVPQRGLKGLIDIAPSEAIITAQWPARIDLLANPDVEEQIGTVQAVIKAIREIRNQYTIAPSKELEASVNSPNGYARILNANADLVRNLAGLAKFEAGNAFSKPKNAAAAIVNELQVYVHDVIDPAAEKARLEKQKQNIINQIKPIEAKLSNENFVQRAKADVVLASRDKLSELKEQLAAVEKHLSELDER
jgi:valyl-tRNA synthetase